MIRIMPDIPRIHAHWCKRTSEIPDWLEVPLSNGQVIKYYPKVEQPAFRRSLEIIRNMKEEIVGYKAKEPASAANTQPAGQKMNTW